METRDQSMQADQTMDIREKSNGQSDISQTHKEESSKNTQLVEQQPIENTPFWLTKDPESGWFIRWHKYRLTQGFNTPEEAEQVLENNQWNFLAIWIAAITQETMSEASTKAMEHFKKMALDVAKERDKEKKGL